jgi:TM2 domain-containing membrane protein YozV
MRPYPKRVPDPFVALMLEVIGSFFQCLGFGWIYAGRVVWGLALLVGYWLLAGTISVVLIIFSAGLWCFVLPAQSLIVGCLSGYGVYQALQKGTGR